MLTELIETGTHTFEVEMTPGGPGDGDLTISVRLASGPRLTGEQWDRVKDAVARDLGRLRGVARRVRVATAGGEAHDGC